MNMSSILRISDKKTMDLLQEYKNEECLWNTFLEDYPNRQKRHEAAQKIARNLNIPNFEGYHVLFKFKNLRNSYCQELKKIANAKLAGKVHTPKVVWFNLMDSFIKPHLQMTRVGNKLPKPKHTEKTIISAPTEVEAPEIKSDPDEMDPEDWTVPQDLITISDGCYSDSDQEPQNFMEHYIETPSAPVDNHKEDCFDSFGKYISSLLRTLPTPNAIAIQPKIVSLIVEEIQAQAHS